MSHNHVVIWIDHRNAHILSFNKEEYDETIVRAKSHAGHLHTKSGVPGTGHLGEDTHFFDSVAETVKGTLEILIVGPGTEKTAFAKYLAKAHPDVAGAVVGVETSDHPSDPQLLAYARKYFIKADLYH